MNLYDEILSSLPLTAFKLNSAGTGYVDITNRGVAFTPDPSLAFESAIIAGGVSKSMDAKNTTRAFFPTSSVYIKGKETQSWTMEIWALPRNIAVGNVLRLMSHSNSTDGLSIDQDFIHFKVEFNTLAAIDLTWPMPDDVEAWHIVGTYTPGKMQLYVNAEMVAEAEVSDEQIADGFKSSATTLYVGYATGTIGATVDGIATYAYALEDAAIYRHFMAGRNVISSADIAGVFGGASFDGTSRDIYMVKEWTSDWSDGLYSNVEFSSAVLAPSEDPATGLSRAGQWTGTFEADGSVNNLYGVKVDWDADGSFVIDTSLDNGTTWVAATNGRPILGTWNYVTAGKIILIRVTFTGGMLGDTSLIRRLRVTGYDSPYVYSTDATRTIQLSGDKVATASEHNEPIENNIRAGFESFASLGSYYILPDTDPEPKNIAALEFWVKFNGTVTSKYIFDSRPDGGTEYLWASGSNLIGFVSGTLVINGIQRTANTFTAEANKWYHMVYIFGTPTNVKITIPTVGDRQVAILNTYPVTLSVADAALMYKCYSGVPAASLATENVDIEESTSGFIMYGYDWSISPAG